MKALLLIATVAVYYGCSSIEGSVSDQKQQAVETPPPEPAPPPPGTEGPPLPPQEPSAKYLAKRAAYEAELDVRKVDWETVGLSEDEAKSERRRLKEEMLRPKLKAIADELF